MSARVDAENVTLLDEEGDIDRCARLEKGGAEATYQGYMGGVMAEMTGRRGGIGQSEQAD